MDYDDSTLANNVSRRYVAVKICRGSGQLAQSSEAKILSQIHHNGRGKPGYDTIIQVYDVFTIRGPNGFHECLVTEVVVPLNELGIRQRCSPQKAIEQLMGGFAFLHQEGLAHGGNDRIPRVS